MIDPKYDDRTGDCDQHAVKVEPHDACSTDGGKQIAADLRAKDAEQDITRDALARAADELAGNETCDQSQKYPS